MLIKVGWMHKYRKILALSWWNNYWFVLNQVTCSLSYYKSPQRLKRRGEVLLSGNHIVWLGDRLGNIRMPPWLKKENLLYVNSGKKRLILCCNHRSEAESWKEILDTFRPEFFPHREKITAKILDYKLRRGIENPIMQLKNYGQDRQFGVNNIFKHHAEQLGMDFDDDQEEDKYTVCQEDEDDIKFNNVLVNPMMNPMVDLYMNPFFNPMMFAGMNMPFMNPLNNPMFQANQTPVQQEPSDQSVSSSKKVLTDDALEVMLKLLKLTTKDIKSQKKVKETIPCRSKRAITLAPQATTGSGKASSAKTNIVKEPAEEEEIRKDAKKFVKSLADRKSFAVIERKVVRDDDDVKPI